MREIQPRTFFAFGGNASLGPELTLGAIESDDTLTAAFAQVCTEAERALGLRPADALDSLRNGSPAHMQSAFALLSCAALEKAHAQHGRPHVYMGLSVGNALACFAGLGLSAHTCAVYLYLRGYFMQQSASRVGMQGPPYNNLAAVVINEGGREEAHRIHKLLQEERKQLSSVAIFRHGGVTVSSCGDIADLRLERFGAVTLLKEMGYHLPYAMEEAATHWRARLAPLYNGSDLDDQFFSGMNGHCTVIGPSRPDRLDAIVTEMQTPFGWDMLCDQIGHGDTIVHIGVRIKKRQRDLLRAITPLPSDVTWHLVTA